MIARAVALLAASAAVLPGDPPPPPPPPRDVSALLEPLLEKHGIPGMAGAIVTSKGLVAIGAAGVREKGRDRKVTTGDLWHLGSCTKAMTATLCAMLVEDGKLTWDGSVADAFADLPEVDPRWKTATLAMLCNQTAGAPADLSADGLWARLWAHRGPPLEQRRALAEGVLAKPPLHEPGSKFLYANASFALAGTMAERAAKAPWEDLLRERLFRPLGMDSAGYGAPGTAKEIDQPRGHTADGRPVPPGPGSDNPAAIGPAGTVHASIKDWGKFVSMHLREGREDGPLLEAATLRRLHDAPVDGYAMGWRVADRPWAGGRALTHAGSNTMWYCVAWLAPARDFAVLVCCNRGGEEAARGCDAAAGVLVRNHAK